MVLAVKAKLGRMGKKAEYYANELSVGKSRRYSAMETLVAGLDVATEDARQSLVSIAGTNGIGAEGFLSEYLFDGYQGGGESFASASFLDSNDPLAPEAGRTGETLGDLFGNVFSQIK